MEEKHFRLLNRIRDERRKKKISQKRLGDLIGLAQPTVNHLESGRSGIDLSIYIKICEVLEIEPFEKEKDSTPMENAGKIEKLEKDIEQLKDDMKSIKKGIEEIKCLFYERKR